MNAQSNNWTPAEKALAQAAAARKPINKARALKRPGKGNRKDWKRER